MGSGLLSLACNEMSVAHCMWWFKGEAILPKMRPKTHTLVTCTLSSSVYGGSLRWGTTSTYKKTIHTWLKGSPKRRSTSPGVKKSSMGLCWKHGVQGSLCACAGWVPSWDWDLGWDPRDDGDVC